MHLLEMQLMRIAHILMGNNGRTAVLKAERCWIACFCNMISIVQNAACSVNPATGYMKY